ncbi:hypothetical protein M8C21_031185, partial [Ambrosia artemisiifolia]
SLVPTSLRPFKVQPPHNITLPHFKLVFRLLVFRTFKHAIFATFQISVPTSGGKYIQLQICLSKGHAREMANLEFSHLHNVCACLNKSSGNTQFHDVLTFLEHSSISFAIQERPPVFDQLVRSFWDSAQLHDEDNIQGIAATVFGHEIVITQAMIRDSLHLNDADGAISYSESKIHHCFQSIGYDAAPTKKQYKKALLSSQWRYIAHVILKCISCKKATFDDLSQQQAAAMAGLIYHNNFSFSNMIFQNLRLNVQGVGDSNKFLLYPRFLQIIFNDNIHGLPQEGATLGIAHMDLKVFSYMKHNNGLRFVELFPHMLDDVEEPMPNIVYRDDVKLRKLHYLIKLLLPFVNQIRIEQENEIVMEANARVTVAQHQSLIFTDAAHAQNASMKYELRNNRKHRRTSTSHFGFPLRCPSLVDIDLGKHALNLKSIERKTWISDLEAKAEHIMNKLTLLPENKHDLSKTSGDFDLKASNRETSDDNYLYFCSSKDVLTEDALIRFRHHLTKGEPIVIKDVLDQSCGISWEPMVMSRALCEHVDPDIRSKMSQLQVIDCCAGDVEKVDTKEFFKCYIEGKKSPTSPPQMLKLKDFPPNDKFDDILPRHCDEFIKALPFREYTDPKAGFLNLAANLPPSYIKPDLGPKAYIACGMAQELERGNSVTNLHCDMSDAVNILAHIMEVAVSDEQQLAVNESSGRVKRDDGDSENFRYRGDIGEACGALWDIFRREDVNKLENYLLDHSNEFGLHAVDSCTKVAIDFVSPENIKECMRLKDEIRRLPTEHKVREDKLEIKKMVLHAMAQTLTDIEALISKRAESDDADLESKNDDMKTVNDEEAGNKQGFDDTTTLNQVPNIIRKSTQKKKVGDIFSPASQKSKNNIEPLQKKPKNKNQ